MWLVKPGQLVAIRRPEGEDVPAIVRHIPSNPLDRRVLIELEGYQLMGRRSLVIRRSALRRRHVIDLTSPADRPAAETTTPEPTDQPVPRTAPVEHRVSG